MRSCDSWTKTRTLSMSCRKSTLDSEGLGRNVGLHRYESIGQHRRPGG